VRSISRGPTIDSKPDRNAGHSFSVAPLPAISPVIPKTEKAEMNNDQKQECIDSMIRALESTSAWRKGIVAKFPNDPRLLKAAATLDQLAIDVVDLSDEQFLDLKPFFGGWSSDTWRAGLSLTARQVGFHNRAKDLKSFVKILAYQFSLSSIAA
jgi:hypothetical protein